MSTVYRLPTHATSEYRDVVHDCEYFVHGRLQYEYKALFRRYATERSPGTNYNDLKFIVFKNSDH